MIDSGLSKRPWISSLPAISFDMMKIIANLRCKYSFCVAGDK